MLIDYCYSGKLLITDKNIINLLAGSNYLRLIDAEKECCEFLNSLLKQNPKDCLTFYFIAEQYSFKVLIEEAILIAVDLFELVTKNIIFLELPFEVIKKDSREKRNY